MITSLVSTVSSLVIYLSGLELYCTLNAALHRHLSRLCCFILIKIYLKYLRLKNSFVWNRVDRGLILKPYTTSQNKLYNSCM